MAKLFKIRKQLSSSIGGIKVTIRNELFNKLHNDCQMKNVGPTFR